MNTFVRSTLAALAALTLSATAGAQDVSSYPSRPITLVVPSAPAGGSDTIARVVADALGKALKQTVIVDNRPGANGIIGVDYVAKAQPDGYRLLFAYAASMVVNPSLYPKLPYDPVKNFAPVAQVGRGGNLLVVRKDLPVESLQEFVAYAQAHPDKLNYCSWGSGSGGHLAMESLKQQAGLVMTHVPYKGSAACAQDLMGGQIDAGFVDASSSVELVRSGALKALTYSGPARLPMLPEVPTMNESGYPFTNYTWYGVFAPAKTPSAIVQRLNAAISQAQQNPALIKRMHDLNITDLPLTTPEQFGATVSKDLQDWNTLIKSIGLSLYASAP